jgi:hypothetical protein
MTSNIFAIGKNCPVKKAAHICLIFLALPNFWLFVIRGNEASWQLFAGFQQTGVIFGPLIEYLKFAQLIW